MKPLKILFPMVFFVIIVSCGGGGGGESSSSGGSSSLVCDNNGVPKFSITSDSTAKVGQPFTETYSWCDSDGDIAETWSKVTFQGRTTTSSINASEMGISGPSGSKENKYTWTVNTVGDFFMDFWLKDAKGNVSNTVSLKVTVNAKEIGQFKVAPSFGGGIIDRVLRRMN